MKAVASVLPENCIRQIVGWKKVKELPKPKQYEERRYIGHWDEEGGHMWHYDNVLTHIFGCSVN